MGPDSQRTDSPLGLPIVCSYNCFLCICVLFNSRSYYCMIKVRNYLENFANFALSRYARLRMGSVNMGYADRLG